MRLIIALLAITFSCSVFADKYVNGYVRKDGTYVQPHYRTDANNSKFDNYSTQGNVNPYTGQDGHVDPYKYEPKSYNYTPPSNGYQNPYNTN